MMTHRRVRRPARSMTIGRRFAVIAAALAVAAASCTPHDAMAVAAAHGVSLTPEQAVEVAARHAEAAAAAPARPDSIDPASISPEQARAIAWTVAVAERQRFMDALRPVGTTDAMWAALLRCEGSGNIRAVSRSGKYRTGFQMDRSFWLTYGGDPAYANPPRWEQAPVEMIYAVAYAGYRARGRSPWAADSVKCGVKAGFPAHR